MPLKLTVEVITPLDEEDEGILAALVLLPYAIKQARENGRPVLCAQMDPRDENRICTLVRGHEGRHDYVTVGPLEGPAN